MTVHSIQKSTAFNKLSNFTSRIGTCGKCMRQAFLAALMAWCTCLFAMIVGWIYSSSIPVMIALPVATLLTALWLLHLIVFGVRVARRHTTREIGQADGAEDIESKHQPSRRVFFSVLSKVISGIALATIIPNRLAYAYGNCNDPNFYPCSRTACVPSGSDNACCPEGAQYLNHCDCKCYKSSSDFDCGSYTFCH